MERRLIASTVVASASIFVIGVTLAAQDKYTVQVRVGSRSLSSGDMKTGRLSPSVSPKTSSI